jgi:hypothetical protein
MKEAQEEVAVTKLQAFQRARRARGTLAELRLKAQGWGGLFYVATRKPLICRESWELDSRKRCDVKPDERVFLCDIHKMPDGMVRALIRPEKDRRTLGWMTAVKEGGRSLQRVPVPRSLQPMR